jgi:hypothetical protein
MKIFMSRICVYTEPTVLMNEAVETCSFKYCVPKLRILMKDVSYVNILSTFYWTSVVKMQCSVCPVSRKTLLKASNQPSTKAVSRNCIKSFLSANVTYISRQRTARWHRSDTMKLYLRKMSSVDSTAICCRILNVICRTKTVPGDAMSCCKNFDSLDVRGELF